MQNDQRPSRRPHRGFSVIIVMMLTALVLVSCSSQREQATLRVGMPWQNVLTMMREAGWRDTLTKFQLEKGFADQGGKMYVWSHPSGAGIYFSTLPQGGSEVLVEMNPSGGETAGLNAKIVEMRVD